VGRGRIREWDAPRQRAWPAMSAAPSRQQHGHSRAVRQASRSSTAVADCAPPAARPQPRQPWPVMDQTDEPKRAGLGSRTTREHPRSLASVFSHTTAASNPRPRARTHQRPAGKHRRHLQSTSKDPAPAPSVSGPIAGQQAATTPAIHPPRPTRPDSPRRAHQGLTCICQFKGRGQPPSFLPVGGQLCRHGSPH